MREDKHDGSRYDTSSRKQTSHPSANHFLDTLRIRRCSANLLPASCHRAQRLRAPSQYCSVRICHRSPRARAAAAHHASFVCVAGCCRRGWPWNSLSQSDPSKFFSKLAVSISPEREVMKTAMKVRRFSGLAAAFIVGVLAVGIVGNATVTAYTANSVVAPYSLAPGASTATYTPVTGTGTEVIASSTTSGDAGVASVTLLRIAGAQIQWVGFEAGPNAGMVHGNSSTAGTRMAYLDNAHTVDLQVGSGETLNVVNHGGTQQTGEVKLLW